MEPVKEIEFFLETSLKCNLNQNDQAPGKEFYTRFPDAVDYIQKIEKAQLELKKNAYEHITEKLAVCTGIVNDFEEYCADCYNLVLGSIAAGIYKCDSNEECTVDSITNKNLLIRNIKDTLDKVLESDIGRKLEKSCQQENSGCKTAINDIKAKDFTSNGFQKQKSVLAALVNALVNEMQNTYDTWVQKNSECEGQILAKCLGMNCIFLSWSFP